MKRTEPNAKFCADQIERLAGLNFFSTLTAVGVKELRDALLNGCASQAQAEAVTTLWLSQSSERPTPADLYRIARSMEGASFTVLPPACDECAEVPGYRRVKTVISEGVFAGEERDALALCSCPRGRALGEAALRVKAETPLPRSGELQKLMQG